MEISNQINISIEDKTDEELFDLAQMAKFRIVELYEKEKLGDPDEDFAYGACGILASMLYNIFAGKAQIYLSADHAIVKIGTGYHELNYINSKEIEEQINAGIYYPINVNDERDKHHFYLFLDRCKKQAVGPYGAKLVEIEKQVMKEMNFIYVEKDEKQLKVV